MIELKPCPFCGVECSVARANGEYKVVGRHDEDCPISLMLYGFFFESEAAAVEAWNKRAKNDKD